MYALITFTILLFSMSQTRPTEPAQPDVDAAAISGIAPAVSDIDRFHDATVYSGSAWSNCLTTNSTFSAR